MLERRGNVVQAAEGMMRTDKSFRYHFAMVGIGAIDGSVVGIEIVMNQTDIGIAQLTFIVAFVPFMPLAMTLPSCTNTHPTGVSSDLRASSAYSTGKRQSLARSMVKRG